MTVTINNITYHRLRTGDLVAPEGAPGPPGYEPDPRIPNRWFRARTTTRTKRPCRNCRGL